MTEHEFGDCLIKYGDIYEKMFGEPFIVEETTQLSSEEIIEQLKSAIQTGVSVHYKRCEEDCIE